MGLVQVEKRSLAPRGAISFTLPFPPSVNNLYANGSGGRYPTKNYSHWREEAGWKIKTDRAGRISGPVRISFIFEEKRGRHDIDNLLKPVIDLLCTHHVIDGDHIQIVREINAKWGNVFGCLVTVETMRP